MNQQNEKMTGYPSIDKPWLKYYSEEAINAKLPECTMYEYLYENNKEHLLDYALNYFGNRITYGELFENIDIVANAFLKYGVKAGDVVSVVTVSTVPCVLILYALNKIGAVSNFVNVMADEKDLTDYFRDAGSRLVVSLDLFADKVIAASKQAEVTNVIVYSIEAWMPTLTKCGYKFKTRKQDKSYDKDAMVIWWEYFIHATQSLVDITYKKAPDTVCVHGHTGGTTGFPKTVLLNDNSFNAVVWQYIQSFPHHRKEVFLNVVVPFVVYGIVTNIHMPLCLGLEVVLIPKFDPDKWNEYCRKYHPNHISAIPAYVSAMCTDEKLAKMNLSGLKTVGMGGEGMNISLEERVNHFLEKRGSLAKVIKGYGMTEVCATATCELKGENKVGSVGLPFIHNIVMIYDNENNAELKYMQTGEICLQCASEMMGYKDNLSEMQLLIKEHPDGSKWIHTGDLGYMDEDGFLFVQGRMKRMIMTINDGLGYKVFPAQIEEILNKHTQVRESCVVSLHMGNDIKLKAVIRPDSSITDSEREGLVQELNIQCSEELAVYQVPVEYDFVVDFPRTAAGKIDYRKLEEEC
ncbi:MAG: class I adenylate-forming enzyme family protein [Lachnospiraceae bacterium]